MNVREVTTYSGLVAVGARDLGELGLEELVEGVTDESDTVCNELAPKSNGSVDTTLITESLRVSLDSVRLRCPSNSLVSVSIDSSSEICSWAEWNDDEDELS